MARAKKSLSITHPELVLEWDYDKNQVIGLAPEQVSHGSTKKVWWLCEEGHSWQAYVSNRTRGIGCPFCSGRRVLPSTSLAVVNPGLACEWDFQKNKETPDQLSYGSTKNVWWLCARRHSWKASLNNRSQGKGCPYCSGQKVCLDNCLATISPVLAKEWHPTKNLPGLTPETITARSNRKVWWLCEKGHEWRSTVKHRAIGCGCPYCVGGRISKVSQLWLDSLCVERREVRLEIRSQHSKTNVFTVDGFDPTTNTVYEFLGNYWHGNPEVFDPEGVNPRTSEKYGVLYRRTLRRLELLKKAGYTVVFIWENDFKKLN